MIKQLKMINKENLIVIEDSENNELFQINLDNMIFDSQKFYESFFKGLSEKIEYNLSNTETLDIRLFRLLHVYCISD